MPPEGTDFFDKPFDPSTKVKLDFFKKYLNKWIPVFIRKGPSAKWKKINIVDFFSGAGYDSEGNIGSPILILDSIKQYIPTIIEENFTVRIILNDNDPLCYKKLHHNVDQYDIDRKSVGIEVLSEDFTVLFNSLHKDFSKPSTANLLILDQYGIKHVTREIFEKLITCKTTDFIFFISSEFFHRFRNHEICKKLELSENVWDSIDHEEIHNIIWQQYRSFIPLNRKYFLSKFTIKKKSNIYGLIFGSHHIRGMEKFIDICWEKDPLFGESSHPSKSKIQLNLFNKEPTKVDLFEKSLSESILSGRLGTNHEIYKYTITQGFQSKHARQIVKKLVDEGKIAQKINISNNSFKKPPVRIELT